MNTAAALNSLRKIVDLLHTDKILSDDDALRARGGSVKQHPLKVIASLNLTDQRNPSRKLTGHALGEWYASKLDLKFYHINPLKIDVQSTCQVMNFGFAKRNQILCVEANPDSVVVATAKPDTTTWVATIEQTTKKRVEVVFAPPDEIERYIVEFYKIADSVSGARDGSAKNASEVTNFEQLLDLKGDKEPGAEDKHIVNIVDWLLQYAFSQRASDIHVEPRREMASVRFRIDGVLHDVYEMPRHVATAVTSRIKVLGRMDVSEKRRPQDGRIKTRSPDGNEVELRLSTLPTAFGEKMVMRIFDPEVLMRSFSEMGLSGSDHDIWMELMGRSSGIVLVTGPTGSGKTTTLYTSLRKVATSDVNVSTLEDPIEMVVDDFNQTQIQPKIDLTFAMGIRTLLRQDPDIIMVGEIRDLETAEMAVQAALTGHLVLSTLHTNDAPSAISRLLDLGLPAHLIRATLNGVMAQRLVRKLCEHCRVEVQPDRDAWNLLVQPFKSEMPSKIYQAGGCLECRNTGYMGREGLYELLVPNNEIRKLITDNCELEQVRMQAFRSGTKTLRLCGAVKVAQGKTTIEEVLRVTPVADID